MASEQREQQEQKQERQEQQERQGQQERQEQPIQSDGTAVDEEGQEPKLGIVEYMTLMQEYRLAVTEARAKFERLDKEAGRRLRHNPIHGITSRIKSPTSIIEKLRRRGFAVTVDNIRAQITDVAGVRIVCNYLDDVDAIADALLGQDDVRLIARKDYVANPKESGYRSLHLVVAIPVCLNGSDQSRAVPVEVQIRTIAMDFWATLEHRLRYKNRAVLEANGPKVDDIRQRLIACADQIAAIDQAMQQIQLDIDELRAEQAEALLNGDALGEDADPTREPWA